MEDYDKIIVEFVEKSKELFGQNLVSVILYGSVARGTAKEHSDIDLLMIVRGLPKRSIERQKILSKIILEFINKYHVRVSPILLEPSDVSHKMINPLIYGVLVGYRIIYDSEIFWMRFLSLAKPVILDANPEYIEDDKRWRIAAII